MDNIETTIHNLTSPKRGHTFWGMVAVVGLAFGLIWLKHGEWLAHPNDQFLTPWGDGFKNYATTAWHVRHDSSYVHYEGMNYPYGEHVLFTDNQPIFSAFMQWWSENVGDVRDQTVGWMAIFQVISMLLGAAFLFLLFRKLHLPVWYAGLATLGMTFLAPQWMRFDGHFGLSHTFVIPGMLYLLCLYEERQSKRYQSLIIGILVWFSAQLHFYYLGLAALFLSLYTAYQVLHDFSWKNIRARVPHWMVMILLPFALLNVWLHWADFVNDRPNNPYGFADAYLGFWEGIFLPYPYFPEYQWISKNITKIRELGGEAQAYVGLVAFLFTLWLFFGSRIWRFVQDIQRKETVKYALKRALPQMRIFPNSWSDKGYHRVHLNFLRGIFSAAFFLTVFSCGFPFAIKGLEWTLDYMGPLRQFRGLGRFTWAYFYVINVVGFYSIWNFSHRLPEKWKQLAFCLVPVVLLSWEAWFFQKNRHFNLSENTEIKANFAKTSDHWLNKVDFSKYQALLPLPYYHMGSENIWLDVDGDLFTRTQLTAYHTGVPDMGVNMSRTSISQTMRSVQLVLEPGELPAILADLPNSRPLAIMTLPQRWDEAVRRYPHLISKAKKIYENADIRILELPLDSLRAAVHERAAAMEKEVDARAIFPAGKWFTDTDKAPFYYQSYDSLINCEKVFQGKGAYEGIMGDTTSLYRGPLAKGEYSLSMWIRVNQDQGMIHEVKFFEHTNGVQGHWQHEGLRFYVKSIVGDWALFDVKLNMEAANSDAHIYLHKKGVKMPFFVDEVLLRPVSTEVFRKESGWVVKNNAWVRK